MSELPPEPQDALPAEDLDRFVQSCSRERRSPLTHKTMDATSYAWVHRFIQAYSEDPTHAHPESQWLAPTEAHPKALSGFFERVGHRIRRGEARDYALALAGYFHDLDERLYGWPGPA